MINNYGNRNVSMILENMRRLMNEDDASSNSTEIDIKNAIPVMVKGELYRDWETDRKSTRLNSSHSGESRMPSSA